jgi:putative transposase
MDETYLKIKGKDVYLYRAVDKFRKTIDFKLSEKRNKKAAFAFFQKCINQNGLRVFFFLLKLDKLNI